MYELARGPLVWVAVIVFVAGTIYRAVQLFGLTEKKIQAVCPSGGIRTDSPEERKFKAVVAWRNSLIGRHPVMAVVSLVFHLCLFVVPVLTLAHNLLLRESFGISFFSLPDRVIDILTAIVLAGGLFFLMRRLVVPRVRAVSAPSDFLVLLIATAPFLTGFIAYHQWIDARAITTVHVLAGELMLIAMPFTKAGHMVFFFFARIFFGSEFSLGRGRRVWST
jgi:nitrate reductase gamma subunit